MRLPRASLAAILLLASCSSSSTPETSSPAKKHVAPRPLDPYAIRQFENALPMIPVRAPDSTAGGVDRYTVTARQGVHDFGLRRMDGSQFVDPATGAPIVSLAWGYDASYLGATIEARSNRPVAVKYVNGIVGSSGQPLAKHLLTVDHTLHGARDGEPEVRIVPHLHGGHVAAAYDGNPEFWFTSDPAATANGMGGPAGNTVTYSYENDQRAATLWFHDHALGVTRLNVYAGLAAFYLLRDDAEDALGLPGGAFEVPLVLQDKSFNDDGSLAYYTVPLINPYTQAPLLDANGEPMYSSRPEFFGDAIIVNGVVWPYLDVERRRYRLRLVNGSDSRFYGLWAEVTGEAVAPPPMVQIGNDGGLLPSAVTVGADPASRLLIAPGERADLVIDFSDPALAGKVVTLRNDGASPFPDGDQVDPLTTGRIMQFRVAAAAPGTTDTSAVPATPAAQVVLPAADASRVVDLQELVDVYQLLDPETGLLQRRLELRLNGLEFAAPVTETPSLGAVEDWTIVNSTGDTHPMHLHLVAFQVIEKGSYDPSRYTPAAAGNMPVLAAGALEPDTDLEGRVAGDPGFDSAYTVEPNEQGLKDTVRVPPGGYVVIRSRFDRAGRYMWHCHILAHEEHDMMRPFEVLAP